MKKKTLALILTMALVTTALTACGKDEVNVVAKNDTAVTETVEETEVVEVIETTETETEESEGVIETETPETEEAVQIETEEIPEEVESVSVPDTEDEPDATPTKENTPDTEPSKEPENNPEPSETPEVKPQPEPTPAPQPTPQPEPEPTPAVVPDPTPVPAPEPAPCAHHSTSDSFEIVKRTIAGGCYRNMKVKTTTCDTCGTVMGASEELFEECHDSISIEPPIPATCTTDGKDGVGSCSCGFRGLFGGQIVPALGHSYHSGYTGEVNEFGNRWITWCTRCGHISEEKWIE